MSVGCWNFVGWDPAEKLTNYVSMMPFPTPHLNRSEFKTLNVQELREIQFQDVHCHCSRGTHTQDRVRHSCCSRTSAKQTDSSTRRLLGNYVHLSCRILQLSSSSSNTQLRIDEPNMTNAARAKQQDSGELTVHVAGESWRCRNLQVRREDGWRLRGHLRFESVGRGGRPCGGGRSREGEVAGSSRRGYGCSLHGRKGGRKGDRGRGEGAVVHHARGGSAQLTGGGDSGRAAVGRAVRAGDCTAAHSAAHAVTLFSTADISVGDTGDSVGASRGSHLCTEQHVRDRRKGASWERTERPWVHSGQKRPGSGTLRKNELRTHLRFGRKG